ncbi:tetraacyldisaccharide 4'-kinase [Salinispirillum marinum]|uniref:Tetraacyldisaccharide 4'-kinase n=2 Tax=Saccharospirillaceae TaxID=255527 RepID=A0ABV8BGJ8_9GAMM
MPWPRAWRQRTPLSYALWPLSVLYRLLSRWQQKRLLKQQVTLSVPVIVVGNIVVGGTGKTPFLLWFVEFLRQQGYRPGIVSRGYGRQQATPSLVQPTDSAVAVGDEPLLIAQHANVPVCVGQNRLMAAQWLMQQHPELDVIISDDGLQHLRLPRDLEICLFDGQVVAGNRWLLPAGPLREPLGRLAQVNLVIGKGRALTGSYAVDSVQEHLQGTPTLVMQTAIGEPVPMTVNLSPAPDSSTPIIAYCGIGQPESFFSALRAQGWNIRPFVVSDHAPVNATILEQFRGQTVFMTSKDAVKFRAFELPFAAYEVPLRVQFSDSDMVVLRQVLASVLTRFL